VSDIDWKRSVQSRIKTTLGDCFIVWVEWGGEIDAQVDSIRHNLRLLILPRLKKEMACFPDIWQPSRFEPVGELFFMPSNIRVKVLGECQQEQSIVCSFDRERSSEFLDQCLPWTESQLSAGLDITSPVIRNLLFRIGQELRAPGFWSKQLVELMHCEVLIELSRYLLDASDKCAVGGLAPWRMRLVDERVRRGDKVPTLPELAALCNMSVRHLTRAFRASSGRSIGEYIAEHRINEAKMLLLSGMSVRSVSQHVGFTAANNFTAAFRRHTGETPAEFKRRKAHS
jgi:AraC family transcriptional regulator